MSRMKKLGILTMILGLACGGVGCNRSEKVAEPQADGAAFSELGEVSPGVEGGAGEEATVVEGLGEEQPSPYFGKRPKKEKKPKSLPAEEEAEPESLPGDDEVDAASAALDRAKVHIELGDYDFAAEELRKIGEDSLLYEEAQRLLREYQ